METPAVVAEAEAIVDDVLGQELDLELARLLNSVIGEVHQIVYVTAGRVLSAEQRVYLAALVHSVESLLELLERER